MNKRLLIITYYWPPYAGGGVQRWLKFAKYLPEYNWTPIIYTPENPSYSLQDQSLLEDVSEKLEVIKRPIWEPYDLANIFKNKNSKESLNTGQTNKSSKSKKVLNWIRGNFFIPDPRKFWVKPSIAFLGKYLEANPVDAVITTGPPHSMHLIGLGLKKKFDTNWIVDIRDPWSSFDLLEEYQVSSGNLKKYQDLESEVLKNCDRVIATSPSMPTKLQSFNQNKFFPITNGFDTSDFKDFKDTSAADNLVLYHAGLMSGLRNPTNFWKALNQLLLEKLISKDKFTLNLVGVVESSVEDSINTFDHLSKTYVREDYKNHKEVITDYQTANVLMLFVNNTDNAKVNIPGKSFEYLATGKPILCFTSGNTDIANILKTLDHCLVLDYNEEVPKVKKKLITFFSNILNASTLDINKYSRSHLTSLLVQLLDNLT